MIRTNGYPHRSSIGGILAFVDGLLIFFAFFMGIVLRFWGENNSIIPVEYPIWKIATFIPVIQITFYYFGLYELKIFSSRMRMSILLGGGLGFSFLVLAILYYSIPSLAIGRGVITISVLLIFLFAFLSRLVFTNIWRKLVRERILIVGTGELAKRIATEIYENGQDTFEIVGFVAE